MADLQLDQFGFRSLVQCLQITTYLLVKSNRIKLVTSHTAILPPMASFVWSISIIQNSSPCEFTNPSPHSFNWLTSFFAHQILRAESTSSTRSRRGTPSSSLLRTSKRPTTGSWPSTEPPGRRINRLRRSRQEKIRL